MSEREQKLKKSLKKELQKKLPSQADKEQHVQFVHKGEDGNAALIVQFPEVKSEAPEFALAAAGELLRVATYIKKQKITIPEVNIQDLLDKVNVEEHIAQVCETITDVSSAVSSGVSTAVDDVKEQLEIAMTELQCMSAGPSEKIKKSLHCMMILAMLSGLYSLQLAMCGLEVLGKIAAMTVKFSKKGASYLSSSMLKLLSDTTINIKASIKGMKESLSVLRRGFHKLTKKSQLPIFVKGLDKDLQMLTELLDNAKDRNSNDKQIGLLIERLHVDLEMLGTLGVAPKGLKDKWEEALQLKNNQDIKNEMAIIAIDLYRLCNLHGKTSVSFEVPNLGSERLSRGYKRIINKFTLRATRNLDNIAKKIKKEHERIIKLQENGSGKKKKEIQKCIDKIQVNMFIAKNLQVKFKQEIDSLDQKIKKRDISAINRYFYINSKKDLSDALDNLNTVMEEVNQGDYEIPSMNELIKKSALIEKKLKQESEQKVEQKVEQKAKQQVKKKKLQLKLKGKTKHKIDNKAKKLLLMSFQNKATKLALQNIINIQDAQKSNDAKQLLGQINKLKKDTDIQEIKKIKQDVEKLMKVSTITSKKSSKAKKNK